MFSKSEESAINILRATLRILWVLHAATQPPVAHMYPDLRERKRRIELVQIANALTSPEFAGSATIYLWPVPSFQFDNENHHSSLHFRFVYRHLGVNDKDKVKEQAFRLPRADLLPCWLWWCQENNRATKHCALLDWLPRNEEKEFWRYNLRYEAINFNVNWLLLINLSFARLVKLLPRLQPAS